MDDSTTLRERIPVMPLAGALLFRMRSCRSTSSRARFTGFEPSAPFPIAHIVPLESESNNSVQTDALSAKVIELYFGN
jgi:hypothetical protein